MPRLANLSVTHGVKLVIKLHPAESRRERERLVRATLSPEQMKVTTLIEGPLTEDLLDVTWFGVTVLSTSAVDCAKRGIPCFLCKWLEYWPYGYIDQFERFGVGKQLQTPEQINEIPHLLKAFWIGPEVQRNLWNAISPERLRVLLGDERDKVDPPS
jgi:hypothetical protein